MPRLGRTSLRNLETCDERLQRVAHRAIEAFDFKVICGHRGEQEQQDAYLAGNSQLRWPYSEHNKLPSTAFDAAPYPIDWEDIGRFKEMGRVMLDAAQQEHIALEWGGDWETFKDYPHFQLAQED